MRRKTLPLFAIILLISGCFSQLSFDGERARPDVFQSETRGVLQEQQGTTDQRTQVSRLEEFSRQDFSGSDLKLDRVLDENAAYTRYYVTYQSGGLTISGIMNVPKGQGPFPLLVLNHGYIDPAIYTNGRGLKREQDYLTRRGYVVLHSDYRNHADSTKVENVELDFRLGYVEDVINAINAMKDSGLDFIDTAHIGMLGHSMGGGIAQTIMVTHPDLVDAFVLFAPVSSNYVDSFNKWVVSRREVAAEIQEMYGSPEEAPDFWAGLSPMTYFDSVSSPVMLHHGTEDASVPLAWSERTVELLRQKRKDIIFHVYEGEKHEFINQWPLVMQRTVDFFDEHLK